MPRLNKFIFSLETAIQKTRDIDLSSNEQVQRTFIQREFQSVGSYLETFSPVDRTRGHAYSTPYQFSSRSHVYSLPYQFERFSCVTNSIPTGIFHTVVILLVTDIRAFEHEFFRIISQSFPLLKSLYLFNSELQKNKHEPRKLITFSRLIYLNLYRAHRDYAEEFLVDESCHLPRLVDLKISYESLVSLTNNFTNDATRLSCSRLTRLRLKEPFVRPEHFPRYFSALWRWFLSKVFLINFNPSKTAPSLDRFLNINHAEHCSKDTQEGEENPRDFSMERTNRNDRGTFFVTKIFRKTIDQTGIPSEWSLFTSFRFVLYLFEREEWSRLGITAERQSTKEKRKKSFLFRLVPHWQWKRTKTTLLKRSSPPRMMWDNIRCSSGDV